MADLISRDAAKAAIRSKFQSVASRCEINEVLNSVLSVDAIPVERLRKMRDDDRLTIDDVETIDLILAWWQNEQEAKDGKAD